MDIQTESPAVVEEGMGPCANRRPRHCRGANHPIVERQSGDNDAVLAWLTARRRALLDQGRGVRRSRFRQRRRFWAAKIAYDLTPLRDLPAEPVLH